MEVTIVGAGALGSHLVLLARNWKVQLKVIDFDRVEQKNTQSQMHSRMSLRKNKAQGLKQLMNGLYGTNLESVPNKLTENNVSVLLGSADLVIDCTDNAEARGLIQTFTRDNGIPCVHGALSANGDFSRIVWSEHFVIDEEGEPGQATCEDGENLPFHAVAAGILAMVTQQFLSTGQRRSFQLSPSLVRLA